MGPLESNGETGNANESEENSVESDANGTVLLVVLGATANAASAAGVLVGTAVVAGAAVGSLDVAVATLVLRSLLVENLANVRDIFGGGDIKRTTDILKSGESSLLEGTTELDGTANGLELGETGKLRELGVVGDQETATNALEHGERDVREFAVTDERDIAGLGGGEVGSREGLEVVGVEAGRAVDGSEGRSREAGDVGNGHVGDPDEVGKRDRETDAVGLDVEEVVEATKRAGEGGEKTVVVDVELLDAGDIKTLQALEEGVADADLISLGDCKVDGLETGKRLPSERLDGFELGEVDGDELGDVLHLKSTTDRGEVAAGEPLNDTVVKDLEVASDL